MTTARHKHLILILETAILKYPHGTLDLRGRVTTPDQLRDAIIQLETRAAQEWARLSVRHKENARRMQEFLGAA